jgi:UPF0716 family protein affecting phage T7 exclusion
MITPTLGFVWLFLEFFLLIVTAGAIGFGAMLAEILLSGFVGYLLMRFAGRTLFQPAQLIGVFLHATGNAFLSRKPIEWLLLGSLLLIIPGFLSDLVGLVLVARWALHRGPHGHPPSDIDSVDSEVIDVEFDVRDDDRA